MSELAAIDVATIAHLLLERGEVEIARRFTGFIASAARAVYVPVAGAPPASPRPVAKTPAERSKSLRWRKKAADLEARGQLRMDAHTLHTVTDRHGASRDDRDGHTPCSSSCLPDQTKRIREGDRARPSRSVTHDAEHPEPWVFEAARLRPDLAEHDVRAVWWKFATANPTHASELDSKNHFVRWLEREKRGETPKIVEECAKKAADPMETPTAAIEVEEPATLSRPQPEVTVARPEERAELQAFLGHARNAMQFRQAGPIRAMMLDVDEAIAPPSRAPAVA